MTAFKSQYIAFSAPSGAGKTTIIKELLQKYRDLALSVSATTRPRRNYEIDGKDYFFLSMDAFQKAVEEGRFLEYEEVHGNFYGTLKDKVDALIDQGKSVLFDIDVKGALSIKKAYKSSILIFIKPPDSEALQKRLNNRKSEDEETIARRLERQNFEYEQSRFFNFTVINDDLKQAVQEIEKLIIDGQ
jgi:guanylate kinase